MLVVYTMYMDYIVAHQWRDCALKDFIHVVMLCRHDFARVFWGCCMDIMPQ